MGNLKQHAHAVVGKDFDDGEIVGSFVIDIDYRGNLGRALE